MPILDKDLVSKIKDFIPDAEIKIESLVDDNDHYKVEIVSSLFNGKSKLEQHKIVNAALDGCLGTKLHALSIKTIARDKL
jgi:stress-induced morphogen